MKKIEESKIISLSDLEQEEKEIFPENDASKECDEITDDIFSVKNWADMFYYGKSDLMKKRFLEFISKSEFKVFFEALDYEYGINGKKIDLNKAFSMYQEMANNKKTIDIMSMYKMYHIYKNEYKKFGFNKRNKILEKFYLFKCYAHLSNQEYNSYTLVFNRFNFSLEVKYFLRYEDPDLSKFDKFMEHLNKYAHIYKINKEDILLIKAFISFVIKDNKVEANLLLEPLISEGNFQAIYLLTLMLPGKTEKNQFYSFLEKYNYYRCFCDYAIFLYEEMNDIPKALAVLKKAINNGILRANYLYYDIFFSTVDFSKIKDNKEFINDLTFIFNLLINCICLDDAFTYFEFFYLRKICIKHFNLKDFIDKNFYEYAKDFTNMLIQNSAPSDSDDDIIQTKKLIKNLYIRKDYFCEFNLSCGIIYYFGIENLIKPDLKKSLFKFKVAFNNSETKSYKRFSYSYIPKIYEKLIKLKDKSITEEEFKNSKSKLFELYSGSIDINTISYLSSSFFYFLSKLYTKKWGNQGDDIMEYICLQKASKCKLNHPGTGTIILYFRKFKAQLKIKTKNIEIDILKNLALKTDSEGYGDDGSICPICMTNKRDMILYPCKHKFCQFCSNKIMEDSKCPICRNYILFNFDISNL